MGEFVGSCADITTTARARALLSTMHEELKYTVDPQPSFQSFVRTNLAVVRRASTSGRKPLRCVELFAPYVVLRKNGESVEDARDGLVELVAALEDVSIRQAIEIVGGR